MTDNKAQQPSEKEIVPVLHPDTWTTGTEPMSEKQASELESLSADAAKEITPDLSAAGAHIQIEALKQEKDEKDK